MPLRNWRATEESEISFSSGGFDIRGLFGKPLAVTPKAGVILCHGTTNTMFDCPLINEMVQALIPAGFATLRFDFYGSGSSPGVMADKTISILVENLFDGIEFMLEKGIHDIGLFGRSTGGTIVLLGASHRNVRALTVASGVTLLKASFVERWAGLQRKQEELEKEGKRLAGTGAYKGKFELGKGWYDEIDEIDRKINEAISRVKNVLVLATTPDEKVSLQNATKIINYAQPPKFLKIFEGTDHAYTGFEHEAVNLSVDWFKRYVKMYAQEKEVA